MYQNILCISMLMFLLSCGKPRSSAKIYKIEGIVENLDKGAIVLEKLDLTTNERAYVSKSPIIDGKFSFSDTISGWGLHSFVIDDSVRIPFFIEPGTISVTIPDYTSNKAKILAGINNDLLDKHQFSFEKSTGMALIEQYPNTTFSAFTTYYVLMNNNFEGDTIDQLVGKLTGEALESVYIPYIKKVAQAIQNVNIGKPAPDFMVKDSSGNEIKMSDMRGKYVLLDFWTSWCKPCREANPMWVELYNKYKNEYIEFFGVSFDVKCKPWINALIKDQLPWPNGCNCQGWDEISDLYGVKSVPQTFLIHPNGTILDKNVKPENFEQVMEYYLKKGE